MLTLFVVANIIFSEWFTASWMVTEMRKIRQRVFSDQSIVDICEFSEFSSVITGLAMAWLCGQMSEVKVIDCSVVVKDENTQLANTFSASIGGDSASAFIHQWVDANLESVIVNGEYQNLPVNFTFWFGKSIVWVAFPRDEQRKQDYAEKIYRLLEKLEELYDAAVTDYFEILKSKDRHEMGGKVVSEFRCNLLTSHTACLAAAGACMQMQNLMLRWVTLFREGKKKTDPDYYALTFKRKIATEQLIATYQGENIIGVRAVFSWNQKYVAVYVDYNAKSITITIDKWLLKSLDQLVSSFNMSIFEAFFVRNNF